jgi:RIO-like serine/threonine protein kinase
MLSIWGDNISRFEHLLKHVKATYGLDWSDLVVLAAIEELSISDLCVKPDELVERVKRNRSWTYRSLRKLRRLKLVNVYPLKRGEGYNLSSWGAIFLADPFSRAAMQANRLGS